MSNYLNCNDMVHLDVLGTIQALYYLFLLPCKSKTDFLHFVSNLCSAIETQEGVQSCSLAKFNKR